MRRPRPGSSPLVAETTVAPGGIHPFVDASAVSMKWDGTAAMTMPAPTSASSASLVTSAPGGTAMPGRYRRFSRVSRISLTKT